MARTINLIVFYIAFGLFLQPAGAAIPRPIDAVGNIIDVKGDEQIRFVTTPDWLPAEIEQDLAGGDTLRTGRFGGLAILFRDQTQIRVYRNSYLLVKAVAAPKDSGQSRLRLERGAVWAREHPVSDGFRMETPAANLAIRGTDWALTVDERGLSTLIVLSGDIEFFNEFGSVRVRRGEIATAEVGKAPTKTFLVNPRDRPQWQLEVGIEWLDLFSVTGMTRGELEELKKRQAAPAQSLDGQINAEQLTDLAAVSFDLHEYALAQSYLEKATVKATPKPAARIRLLQGLLRLRDRAPAEADSLFEQAISESTGRWKRLAEIGRFEAQVEQARYYQAERLLAELLRRYGEYPEVHLAAVWLRSFQGDQERAIREALTAQRRFMRDARFPVLLGHLYLLDDQPEAAKAAIDRALTLDPEQVFGWELKGLYYQMVEAEPQPAIRAYRRALELAPATASVWARLGTVYTDLGEYRKAESAFRQAIRLDPQAAGHKAGCALLLLYLNRPDEAEPLLREALALDPAHSNVLQGMGFLALSRGNMAEAVDWILKATTVNPGLADANTQLGVAYYQEGDEQAAEQALATAQRLDPRDPIPDLFRSVIAQNYAEAGQAIRSARQAFQKYQDWKNYAVETIASDRNGIINLGSAYANLGLREWGNYYAQLSFDPYWANSHFGVSVLYDSILARRGSDVQGLLLDPLAYGSRIRYTDLVRRPFHDLRIGAAAGSRGGAFVDSEFFNINGFSQSPKPLSYQLTLLRQSDNGFRANGDSTTEFAELSAGVKLDEENSLSLGASGGRSRYGIVGPEDQPDLNERETDKNFGATLGYQHRFGARNRLLARAATVYLENTLRNPDPFGSNLSDLEFSLIRFASPDLDAVRSLFDAGVFDASALFHGTPTNPVFVVGPLGSSSGLKPLESGIPDPLDLNPIQDNSQKGWLSQFQLRHLFDLGSSEVTYGAEWLGNRVNSRLKFNRFEALGTGLLTVDGVNFIPFPFGTPLAQSRSFDIDVDGARAYLGSRWKPAWNFWLDGALFLNYYDNGLGAKETEWDPKIGFAWRLTPDHWLRAAAQRELIFFSETLAPVATVGLAIPIHPVTVIPLADPILSNTGFSITDFQLRWDAEWNPFLFTFAQLGQQTLEAEAVSFPILNKGRVRYATVGANLWFLERFGLSTTYRRLWSENLTGGSERGNELPLLPDEQFGIGLSYVHPWQIRASLVQSYVGERRATPGGGLTLSGYWTTDAVVRWEPNAKHWLFSLLAENVFDKDYAVAAGFPAPGRTVRLGVEYRF